MKIFFLLPLLFLQFPDSFIKLDTFQVSFKQTTVSPMFPEITDSGILSISGCRFRFEYTTNEKRITIGDCKNIYQFSEGESKPMIVKWEEIKSNPFLQLLINRDAIKTEFVVKKLSDSPLIYRLVPKKQAADMPFTMLKLTLNKTGTHPVKIEIIDETDQVITYKFSNFRADLTLAPELFDPEGVK
ncbi:MAG: outer membrane lipoprotein carrier protein LolA [Acidobacteria bacterium]|nr:outer membrane lipoprotein carrier protein LolA [Acidobacteriota bacterium]